MNKTVAICLLMVSLLLTGVLTGPAIAKKTPTVQLGPNAEITFDGLHLVNKTKMDKVWVKPEIDLSQYDSVMFQGSGIHYRGVDSNNRTNRSSEFPLSDKQKAQLEQAVRESFEREFEKFEHFEVTEEPGPGTLKVMLALIDVVSRVPPETAGRGSMYLTDLGHATLIVEVFDSVSLEILARIADKQKVEPVGRGIESNPVTNLQEVRRSVRRWGVRIRDGLDELHQVGCYICAVPGSVE